MLYFEIYRIIIATYKYNILNNLLVEYFYS